VIEAPHEILAHFATGAAALSFVAWRKRIKKPLTETAALRLAKTLDEINRAGGDASDALGMAEEHGWQTIKAEWYFGKRTGANTSNTHATVDAINAAARAHRTPREDCF